jgi:hypothetical protein
VQETDETLEQPKKKKYGSVLLAQVKARKSSPQVILDEMKNANIIREANRERRHQEALNVRNRVIDAFSDKMDLIFQQMKK